MKVNLAEAGDEIKVSDDYKIVFSPGDYVVLRFKSIYGHPSCSFFHPNLMIQIQAIHEFRSNKKHWTSKAGYDFYFLINKKDINVYIEKGHSFIHAEINGVDLTFSVCGGGYDVWKDIAGRQIDTNLNLSKRNLNKIAEVAFRDDFKESLVTITNMDCCSLQRWLDLTAEYNRKHKEQK